MSAKSILHSSEGISNIRKNVGINRFKARGSPPFCLKTNIGFDIPESLSLFCFGDAS
jgi:hypothetical protein